MLTLSACGGGAQKVEVFSWWTGGGEAAGLEAMIEVFSAQYPDVEFINAAVAGGAGTNARAVLATRLQAGDPPDTLAGPCRSGIDRHVCGRQPDPAAERPVRGRRLAGGHARDPDPAHLRWRQHLFRAGQHPPRQRAVVQPELCWQPTALQFRPPWMNGLPPWIPCRPLACSTLALGEQWTKMHLMETVLLGTLGPG
ncbi:MAG: hypothetical protein MZV64_60485 [Ignavibacteriales bacterium]|nr:hypothetical protein [Ignavibacteriales bacterium]